MTEKVLAPLAGKVLSVAVTVGDVVEEDDEVLVLEAMKMETVVYAPRDGKVADVVVLSGDPLTLPESPLRDLRVEMTIFNGSLVHPKK